MSADTVVRTDVEQERRDRVAIAAAMAAVAGRPVRIGGTAAHAEGRSEAWVREGRLATQSHRTTAPLVRTSREWSR